MKRMPLWRQFCIVLMVHNEPFYTDQKSRTEEFHGLLTGRSVLHSEEDHTEGCSERCETYQSRHQ